MLFSKHPKSIDPLLFNGEMAQKALAEAQCPPKDRDLSGNFFLIFSVQEVIEFKQDAQTLIRRLSTLCRLLTSFLTAAVAMWLLEVLLQQ